MFTSCWNVIKKYNLNRVDSFQGTYKKSNKEPTIEQIIAIKLI